MVTVTKTPDEVLKDFNGGNGLLFRSTGKYKPKKNELRTLLNEILSSAQQVSVHKGYVDRAAMDADLLPDEGTIAEILSDVIGPITSRSRTSNVATVTITNHGLVVGDDFNVRGSGGEGYDGHVIVTAKTTNTVSYSSLGTDETATACDGIADFEGVYLKQGATGTGSWIWDSDLDDMGAVLDRLGILENFFFVSTDIFVDNIVAGILAAGNKLLIGFDSEGKAQLVRTNEWTSDELFVDNWIFAFLFDEDKKIGWGMKSDGADVGAVSADFARKMAAKMASLGTTEADLSTLPAEANIVVDGAIAGGEFGLIRAWAGNTEGDQIYRPYVQRSGRTTWVTEGARTLDYFPSNGQSLDAGRVLLDAGADQIRNGTPTFPQYVLMLNDGMRSNGNTITDASLSDFVSAYESLDGGNGETGGVAMGNWLHRQRRAAADADRAFLARSNAIGGSLLSQVDKTNNTLPYNNFLVEAPAIKRIATYYKMVVACNAVGWSQGEADDSDETPYADYLAALIQLASDYQTDLQSLLGISNDVYFLMDPPAANGNDGLGRMSALAQIEASRTVDTMIVSTCKYWMRTWGGVHMPALYYAIRGEYRAKVKRSITEGSPYRGFRLSTTAPITRSGAVFTLPLEGRVGAITQDFIQVPEQPNLGLVYKPTTGTNDIASVTVGTDSLVVTLNSDPGPSSGDLLYAYESDTPPGDAGGGLLYFGAAGNIRDNDQTPSYVDSSYSKLYNWLHSFKVALP